MTLRNTCLVVLGCISMVAACTHSPSCSCLTPTDIGGAMVFCYFTNYTTLRMVIPTLPANLTELNLRGSLGALTAGMFSNVPFSHALTTMMFWWDAKIDSVEAGTFKGLTHLTTLGFFSTSLTFIPSGLLDGVADLQKLYFADHRYVTHVESMVFSAGTCVERILFDNNAIETLADATFKNAGNCLVTLSLVNNKIREVSNATFTDLFKLETLALSSNKNLRILPASFNELPSLKSLNLNSVFVSHTLPRNVFCGLNNLRHLSIQDGGLRVLKPADFKPITQLERLDVSNNRIEAFPGALAVLTFLEELRLTRNSHKAKAGLVFNTGAFSAFPKLTTLDMSGTNITQLVSGVFNGLINLTTLDLKHCGLKVITKGVFSGLQNLISLSLDTNELRTLSSEIFKDLASLKTLSLTKNKIGRINDNAFAGLGNLNSLRLDYNSLTTLAGASLKPLTDAEVFLQNNPWNCTCDLDSLRAWIIGNTTFSPDVSCVTPVSLMNRSLANLTHVEICNIHVPVQHFNVKTDAAISISAAMVAVIAAGLIYCTYKYRSAARRHSYRNCGRHYHDHIA